MSESVLLACLGSLAIILVAARLVGRLAERLGQPAVIGEIIAGLMLGPSLLGNAALLGGWAPIAFHHLFPATTAAPIGMIGQLALMLLMFQTGAELEPARLAGTAERRRVTIIAAVSVAVPFAAGVLAGRLSAAALAPGVAPLLFALFVGTAFAITALPILARLMDGFGLTRTRLGTMILAAGTANDLAGWMLLSACIALASAGLVWTRLLEQAACLVVLAGALALLSRWPGRCLLGQARSPDRPMSSDTICFALVLMLTAGACTSAVGLRAIFGAMAAGLACGCHPGFAAAWRNQVAPLVNVMFLPVFFAATGLHVDLRLLLAPGVLAWCAVFIAAAALSKLVPVFLASRACGLQTDSAAVMAVAMNTRGLMELVVLDTGRALGVIPPTAFPVLVVMALATTLPTAPLIRRLLARQAPARAHTSSGLRVVMISAER